MPVSLCRRRLYCSIVTQDPLSIPGSLNSGMKFLLKGLGLLHSLDSSAEKKTFCALAGGFCIKSRSNHTARQHNVCGENSSTGYLLANLMKDTSDLLLLIQNYILRHWAMATQVLSSPHHDSNSIYIPSFELITLHKLSSFVCHNILLRLLIVEFNTQRSRCILLASTNETNY